MCHILFVEDTFIFCEASQEEVPSRSWIFMWFEANSSLKINLEKSGLIPMAMFLEEWVAKMGCRKGELLVLCLDLPLESHYKSRVGWNMIEERVHKRLVMWKRW